MLNYCWIVLIGYLLGTSNMALYISKIKKVDLRAAGSGNLGASNAAMLLGRRAGIITFIHDFIKVIFAAWIVSLLFPETLYGPTIAAASGVMGHMYPFYLKFKGGKGFASYIALAFIVDWRYGLFMIITMAIVALIVDWIVAGTFYYITLTPIFLFNTQGWFPALLAFIVSACIFYKHIENIKRKKLGQEKGIREVMFKKKK